LRGPAARTAPGAGAAKSRAPAKTAAPAPAPAPAGKRPRFLTQARKSGGDDLKQIKGIGPALETKLNEMGVYHYDQIAKWTADNVSWVDDHLNFKGRIGREKWIAQAKKLAPKPKRKPAKKK
jgi:NADH-quinone oxidoreductase subunit E